MADAADRPLTLVTKATTTATGQAQFASHVQAILAQHQDIAAEATWQAMAQLVAEHWLLLANDQRPLDTWGMLSRGTETVLKIRRGQKQGQDSSGQDALEEFRAMMRDVAGGDGEA